jgi:hypothetical protein
VAEVGEKSGFALDAGVSADVAQNFFSQLWDSFPGGRGSSRSPRPGVGSAEVLAFPICQALLGRTAGGGCLHTCVSFRIEDSC